MQTSISHPSQLTQLDQLTENINVEVLQNEINSLPTKSAKYKAEANVDFFSLLNKELTSDSDTSFEQCLITNEPLKEAHVKLDCNHKFNYIPLYNEVKIQKCIKNYSETARLDVTQLKCPYCRKIQPSLLKHVPELNETCPLTYGVNTLDPKHKTTKSCCYVRYTHANGTKSFCTVEGEHFSKHEDGNYYCYSHSYEIKQKEQYLLNKQLALAKKNELKEAKLKQKQDLIDSKKKAKEEAKIAKYAENLQKKLSAKAQPVNEVISLTKTSESTNANEIISLSAGDNKCTQILKTGVSKGCLCGKQVYENNLCKRHYNLSVNGNKNTVEFI
jgi:hypothetical protein